MKGMSMAIETIIYLILAITVLSVLLLFFLTQAGPAQDQYTLEANRNRFCGAYAVKDFACVGKDGTNAVDIDPKVLSGIGTACGELTRRFNAGYTDCSGSASLKCIQECCLTCTQR